MNLGGALIIDFCTPPIFAQIHSSNFGGLILIWIFGSKSALNTWSRTRWYDAWQGSGPVENAFGIILYEYSPDDTIRNTIFSKIQILLWDFPYLCWNRTNFLEDQKGLFSRILLVLDWMASFYSALCLIRGFSASFQSMVHGSLASAQRRHSLFFCVSLYSPISL